MTHERLIKLAECWLRRQRRCGIILTEQGVCDETPDAIGWWGEGQSVLIECKITRSDFLADRNKPARRTPGVAMGSERYYLTMPGLVGAEELPPAWGLLEIVKGHARVTVAAQREQRQMAGLEREMRLVLCCLRRVEVRIEPQTITEFLKWGNRLARYNGGEPPAELKEKTDHAISED